jgi:hypothetical protein
MLILILLCVLCLLVFADVGPSPSYNFSISNANEYSDYSFYYSGNIWENTLIKITEDTWVYKFNTIIKIFAIPKEIESQVMFSDQSHQELSKEKMIIIQQNSFVSDSFKLNSGITKLGIFFLENKKLSVEIVENVPDNNYLINYYLADTIFILSVLLCLFLFFGIIFIIIKSPVFLKKLKK